MQTKHGFLKKLFPLLVIAILIFMYYIVESSFAENSDILIPRFEYETKNKRDPFIPLVTKEGVILRLEAEVAKGPVSLEGIIFDQSGLSYAIVNGKISKVGDTIEGNQLIKIEKDKVTFLKDGSIMEMKLKEEGM